MNITRALALPTHSLLQRRERLVFFERAEPTNDGANEQIDEDDGHGCAELQHARHDVLAHPEIG
jgi:hypothetical protein